VFGRFRGITLFIQSLNRCILIPAIIRDLTGGRSFYGRLQQAGLLLAMAPLISGWAIVNGNGKHPYIDRSRIVWESFYSLQNSLIFQCADREGKTALMMSWLCKKLVINTPEHHENFAATDRAPLFFGNPRIVFGGEPALGNCLTSKNGAPDLEGAVPINIANVILDSQGSFRAANLKGCCTRFRNYEKGRQVPCVFDGEFKRENILASGKYNVPRGHNIGSMNPRSLLGLHFAQLAVESPPTQTR
jgi:hypothetical protein